MHKIIIFLSLVVASGLNTYVRNIEKSNLYDDYSQYTNSFSEGSEAISSFSDSANETMDTGINSGKLTPKEREISEDTGSFFGLFFASLIFFYSIFYGFKYIIKPGFTFIRRDFAGNKNIFEKIFYSKLLGPFLSSHKKNSISKKYEGRILIVLYPILYLLVSIFLVFNANEDLITFFIFFILLTILYKFSFLILSSTYRYIRGGK